VPATSTSGVSYPAARHPIPTYLIHGYGDSQSLAGDLWDDLDNALDSWAAYHLDVNGFSLDDVDLRAGFRSGWYERFRTWTWTDPGTSAPMVKVTRNLYRSHTNIQEETPMLWEFLRHYSHDVDPAGTSPGTTVRPASAISEIGCDSISDDWRNAGFEVKRVGVTRCPQHA